MVRKLAAVVAAIAVLTLGPGCASERDVQVPEVIPASVVELQEDDPGWDCATMGNRMCGGDRRVG